MAAAYPGMFHLLADPLSRGGVGVWGLPRLNGTACIFPLQVLGQVDKKFIACILDTKGSGEPTSQALPCN